MSLPLATLACNEAWDHAVMTEEEIASKEAARARLRAKDEAFQRATDALEAARVELAEEIVAVLRDRILAPSEVDAEVSYDRNHVARIARAGGVPPLRQPKPKRRGSRK